MTRYTSVPQLTAGMRASCPLGSNCHCAARAERMLGDGETTATSLKMPPLGVIAGLVLVTALLASTSKARRQPTAAKTPPRQRFDIGAFLAEAGNVGDGGTATGQTAGRATELTDA